MKALIFPIILQLVGVVVIMAEIILPSAGVLTVMAIAIFGYSLYVAFTQFAPMVGVVFLMVDLVSIPVLVILGLKLLARSPATLRTELSSADGVTSQDPEIAQYVGKSGQSVTDLRPAGIAVIDGQRVDVVTRGEYIDRDTPVVVHAVAGNQIVVKSKL